jgi:hypothetical protein
MTRNRSVLVLVSGIALGGCGGGDELQSRELAMERQAQRFGIDAEVQLDESGEVDQVAVQTLGGMAGQNLDLPESFPEDVSLNPEWNITSVAPVPTGGFLVQALAQESMADIVAGARTRLTATGWTETEFADGAQMTRLSFEKDARMTSLNLISNGAQVVVQLATMPKP